MRSDRLLEVVNLRVSYELPSGRLRAVDGVTFTIRRGEVFGLVGESGSGKTTTALAILRLLKPPAVVEADRITLADLEITRLGTAELRRVRWRRISLVPQGAMSSLNPVMRIRDQIADVIEAHEGRAARRGIETRIAQLLESVGLPERVVRLYPHELSGGMKQRVCIAMAIALRPELIVADEPTSALDVVVQRMVAETLLDVRRQLGASLLLIGHDMGLQAQLVDRLGVMYRGRLVEVGRVADIFAAPIHPYTRILIGSVPSIGRNGAQRARPDLASAREALALGHCGLGAACDRDRQAGADGRLIHEVGPDHLVACAAWERGEVVAVGGGGRG